MNPQVTYVYRLYNEAEELLYVGIAKDIKTRFRQHSGEKTWWEAVASSQIEECNTRAIALAKEATAILRESPKHNRAIPSFDRHDLLQTRADQDPYSRMELIERLQIAEKGVLQAQAAQDNIALLENTLSHTRHELGQEREAALKARTNAVNLTKAVKQLRVEAEAANQRLHVEQHRHNQAATSLAAAEIEMSRLRAELNAERNLKRKSPFTALRVGSIANKRSGALA